MILKNVPFVRLLAVAAPLLFATTLLAQDPAAAAEPEGDSVIIEVFKYDNAGLVGYIIVLMSIVAVALIIENFISITREKLAPPDLLGQIEAALHGVGGGDGDLRSHADMVEREEQLGLRLFERSTRHVELSAEGRDFEPAARRVLAEVAQALDGVRDHAARRRGRVALALLPSLAAGWLPEVLAGFHAEFPGVQVDVADVLSETCIAQLRAGQADLAIAATRAETPELRAEAFHTDGFHLVCPAGHPLLDLPSPRPRDLAAHPFVHLSRTSSVRQVLDGATLPLQMRSLMEVDQLATVMGMVRAGVGISVVPSLALFHFQHPDIATRPLRWPGLERRIFLVRRRDRGLSLAAQSFYDWVMARRPSR